MRLDLGFDLGKETHLNARTFFSSRLATILIAGVALIATVAPSHAQDKKTLYQRLGGYDALAAVTDDFIGRLATDAALAKFFDGHSKTSLMIVRQHIVDQLCAATGGPCYYMGRDMKTAHAGLGISEADWTTSVNHLVATLDKFKVPKAEKDEVLALLTTLKADIVEKK